MLQACDYTTVSCTSSCCHIVVVLWAYRYFRATDNFRDPFVVVRRSESTICISPEDRARKLRYMEDLLRSNAQTALPPHLEPTTWAAAVPPTEGLLPSSSVALSSESNAPNGPVCIPITTVTEPSREQDVRAAALPPAEIIPAGQSHGLSDTSMLPSVPPPATGV